MSTSVGNGIIHSILLLYFTVAIRMDHDFRGRYLIHYTRGSRNKDHHLMYSNKSMM